MRRLGEDRRAPHEHDAEIGERRSLPPGWPRCHGHRRRDGVHRHPDGRGDSRDPYDAAKARKPGDEPRRDRQGEDHLAELHLGSEGGRQERPLKVVDHQHRDRHVPGKCGERQEVTVDPHDGRSLATPRPDVKAVGRDDGGAAAQPPRVCISRCGSCRSPSIWTRTPRWPIVSRSFAPRRRGRGVGSTRWR